MGLQGVPIVVSHQLDAGAHLRATHGAAFVPIHGTSEVSSPAWNQSLIFLHHCVASLHVGISFKMRPHVGVDSMRQVHAMVERFKSAGAIIIGLSNVDELGIGTQGKNQNWGPSRNPHNPAYLSAPTGGV